MALHTFDMISVPMHNRKFAHSGFSINAIVLPTHSMNKEFSFWLQMLDVMKQLSLYV